MPIYTYSARPATGGEMQTGQLELPSKDEVMAHLTRQRLIPVSVREKPKDIKITFGTGVGTRDIVIFTRQFATMINSGLPLVQSLDILAEQTENDALDQYRRDYGIWGGDNILYWDYCAGGLRSYSRIDLLAAGIPESTPEINH